MTTRKQMKSFQKKIKRRGNKKEKKEIKKRDITSMREREESHRQNEKIIQKVVLE